MEVDYYSILGVTKEADSITIREAYKKLALIYHPDKSSPELREAAETKFKAISEAYETLVDEESRMIYDAQTQYGGFDWQDFYTHDDQPPTTQPKHTSDLDFRFDITLQLEDVYTGKLVKLTVFRNIICRKCKNRGCKPGAKLHKCMQCKGKGEVKKRKYNGFIYYNELSKCSECQGLGSKYNDAHLCSRCSGGKTQEVQTLIEVYIPKGVKSGHEIVVEGMGDEDLKTGEPGNIIIVVDVDLDHPVFKRQDLDLYTSVEIPLADALTGCSSQLITQLDNRRLNFTIPRGKIIRPGDILKVHGEGLPKEDHMGRCTYGDMYVEMNVLFPSKIEPHILDKLAPLLQKQGTNEEASTQVTKTEVNFTRIAESDLPPMDESQNFANVNPENIFSKFTFT